MRRIIVWHFARSGWLRVFGSYGPGIKWKPSTEPLLFSERVGITGYVTLFGLRFALLRRGNPSPPPPQLNVPFTFSSDTYGLKPTEADSRRLGRAVADRIDAKIADDICDQLYKEP